MVASTVTAYAVDPATGADLQVLGTAKTDASGNFTVKILSHVSPLRLAVTGGSFISEADGSTVSQPRRVTVLLPSATSDIAGISINPLTRFVNALTIGRLQTGHTTFAAALTNATATIESYYSLSTDPGRLLPDYTVSGIGTDAGKLGLILGALINEDQHLCPGKPGELVTALALDIVSGVFNGRYDGLPVPYCGGALPAIAGTSDFQDALAGVQQLQYVSSGFAFGGLYGPAGNILFNQAPPVTPDLLLASLAAINAAITQAAPSTSSTSSPSMTVARAAATATLLPNGKVLIRGRSRQQHHRHKRHRIIRSCHQHAQRRPTNEPRARRGHSHVVAQREGASRWRQRWHQCSEHHGDLRHRDQDLRPRTIDDRCAIRRWSRFVGQRKSAYRGRHQQRPNRGSEQHRAIRSFG
jgi:hypothetical protein